MRFIQRLRGGVCGLLVRVEDAHEVGTVTATSCQKPNGHRGSHRAVYILRNGFVGAVNWGSR